MHDVPQVSEKINNTVAVENFTPEVVTGFGGKPMPVQPPQPEI